MRYRVQVVRERERIQLHHSRKYHKAVGNTYCFFLFIMHQESPGSLTYFFLDELLEVVVGGGVGGGDVVAVLVLLEDAGRERSPLANAEDEQKEVDRIRSHAHHAQVLDNKVEEVSQVAGHPTSSQGQEGLEGGDKLVVEEGEEEHEAVEGDPVHRVGLVQHVVLPQILADLAKPNRVLRGEDAGAGDLLIDVAQRHILLLRVELCFNVERVKRQPKSSKTQNEVEEFGTPKTAHF